MSVHVENVSKRLADFPALDAVSLEVHAGETLALLGPPGSGKKTLLLIMAGLEAPDSGRVVFRPAQRAGRSNSETKASLISDRAPLFESLPIDDQITFELKSGCLSRKEVSEIRVRLQELIELAGLANVSDHYPAKLSGGHRRRWGFVRSMARALAGRTDILLVEELSNAWDPNVRRDVLEWLLTLKRDLHLGVVLSTQRPDRGLEFGERVAVMANGRIEQVGTPRQAYDEPATQFVCEYLSRANRVDCQLLGGKIILDEFSLPNLAPGQMDGPAVALIRDHDIRLATPGGARGWWGTISKVTRSGPMTNIACDVEGCTVDVSMLHTPSYVQPGEAVILEPLAARAYRADRSAVLAA